MEDVSFWGESRKDWPFFHNGPRAATSRFTTLLKQYLLDLENLYRAQPLGIITAESCTGGLLAASLTERPGSSRYMIGGFITYTDAQKQAILGVRASTLSRKGAVSLEATRQMAAGALRRTPLAHLSVAISGIAGPDGGTEKKPLGTVCFSWGWRAVPPLDPLRLLGLRPQKDAENLYSVSQRFQLQGGRYRIRRTAVLIALGGLCRLSRLGLLSRKEA